MRSKAKPIDADFLDLGEFATMTLDFDLDMTFDLALDDMPEFKPSEADLQWMPNELQEGPLDGER